VIIGLLAPLIAQIVSTIIGAISAMVGGTFDIVVQRFVDGWLAIPNLIITIVVMSIVGVGMVQLVLVIAIPMGIGSSRLIRSAVLGIKNNPYIDVERAIGSSNKRIMFRHVYQHHAGAVGQLFAAGRRCHIDGSKFKLPWLRCPSWSTKLGSMISREGRQYMLIAPLLAIWPGLALSLVVYGANMFGDAVRDLIDPRLKGGLGRYVEP